MLASVYIQFLQFSLNIRQGLSMRVIIGSYNYSGCRQVYTHCQLSKYLAIILIFQGRVAEVNSAAVHSPIQVAKETHGDAAEVLLDHTHTHTHTHSIQRIISKVCFVL